MSQEAEESSRGHFYLRLSHLDTVSFWLGLKSSAAPTGSDMKDASLAWLAAAAGSLSGSSVRSVSWTIYTWSPQQGGLRVFRLLHWWLTSGRATFQENQEKAAPTFYDPASKVTYHHFLWILWGRTVTNSPRFKSQRHRGHHLTGKVSKNFEAVFLKSPQPH